MRSILRAEVVGFKRFKGAVDGKNIDSGKLFVLTRLNGSRNSADSHAAGTCTEEIKLPDGQFCKVLELDQRVSRGEIVTVELELERVSNGRESSELVVGCKLLPAEKPLKAAA
ncbi:hypothetical protein DBR42_07930 [Pelomonas sp. HMWF004]|nr:hypothetical protein DBR42_07930 [Pelomonas sp. HMWF004]